MRSEDDTSELSDDELFQLEADDVESVDFGDDEAPEVDDLLNDVLREDEVVTSRDEERVLRYAVADDRESKASEFRMRSQDIDEGQMAIPKPEALDVENDWRDGEKKIVVNRVFVMGGIVLLAILSIGVIWAAIKLRHGDDVGNLSEREMEKRLELEARSDQEAHEMVEQMEGVCRDYLAADSVEGKAKYVASRDQVLPMMRDYYGKHPLEPEKMQSVEVKLSSDSNSQIFWLVDCRVVGKDQPRRLVVEQRDRSHFEVVWELDVVYQPMSLKEFKEKSPEKSVGFRVMVKAKAKSGFYGYGFSDYKKYRCFQLNFAESDDFLWGYTEIGGEVDKQLYDTYKQVMRKGGTERGFPMMLGLRYLPDGGSDKCVLIDRFLDKDWKID